ncbi:hypothetical protein TYRP_018339 [Tyrophagus putrescentiae]|nr:hypothetical protein TYRP_018339 [Tyrophagus putrescentiae]
MLVNLDSLTGYRLLISSSTFNMFTLLLMSCVGVNNFMPPNSNQLSMLSLNTQLAATISLILN